MVFEISTRWSLSCLWSLQMFNLNFDFASSCRIWNGNLLFFRFPINTKLKCLSVIFFSNQLTHNILNLRMWSLLLFSEFFWAMLCASQYVLKTDIVMAAEQVTLQSCSSNTSFSTPFVKRLFVIFMSIIQLLFIDANVTNNSFFLRKLLSNVHFQISSGIIYLYHPFIKYFFHSASILTLRFSLSVCKSAYKTLIFGVFEDLFLMKTLLCL